MASRFRKRQAVLLVCLIFLLGCATTDLETRVDSLEENLQMLMAAGVGQATRMYGRICTTGANCLEDISGASDGDLGVVIDSSDYLAFYKYEDSSTYPANDPYIVDDAVNGGSERWEMIVGFQLRNADAGASALQIFEDYTTGQEYYEMTVPDDIDTNRNIIAWGWALRSHVVGLTLELDDARVLHTIDTSGASVTLSIPNATGSGIVMAFYVSDASNVPRVDVADAGDRFVGTDLANKTGSGCDLSDYITAGAAGDMLYLIDVSSTEWLALVVNGTWTCQ